MSPLLSPSLLKLQEKTCLSPPASSLVTAENLQLKNIRPLPPNANLLHPFSSEFSSRSPALQESIRRIEYTCSTRICLFMNELYYNTLESKSKTALIFKEIKMIRSAEVANSVFASVLQNLKFYVKEIRNILRSKLRELGLLQLAGCGRLSPKKTRIRRYSADYVNERLQEIFLPWKKEGLYNDELRLFYGAEENYVEFLLTLCEVYKNFDEITSKGPEEVCHRLLNLCKSNTEVTEYDVHKSYFYDYVLKDRIIMVRLSLNILESTFTSLYLCL